MGWCCRSRGCGRLSVAQQDDCGERPAVCGAGGKECLGGGFRPVDQAGHFAAKIGGFRVVVSSVAVFLQNVKTVAKFCTAGGLPVLCRFILSLAKRCSRAR